MDKIKNTVVDDESRSEKDSCMISFAREGVSEVLEAGDGEEAT